jgi:predicted enzyme related to lactoylglutathione lyase
MTHPIAPKLSAVFVHVSDLRRAADFYTQLLGLTYDPHSDYGNGIYVVRLANGEDLVLDANQAPQTTTNDAYKMHATCMFGTQDIDAAHAWMLSQGIEIVTELYRDPNVAFFNFKDPDGNIQMVCQSAVSSGS